MNNLENVGIKVKQFNGKNSWALYIKEGEEKVQQATAASYLANATQAQKEYNLANGKAKAAELWKPEYGYQIYSEEDRVKFLNEASKQKALFERSVVNGEGV